MAGRDDDILKFLLDFVQEEKTKVALDLHRKLVEWTPVDTGEARGGWQVDIPSKPSEAAEVSNAVEHIAFLVEGSSPQAPDGSFDNVIEAVAKGMGD